jgi:hypothetical protein
VPNATAYRVWRGTSEDVSTAVPASAWIPGTQFNDTEVPGPITEAAAGCACGAPTVTNQFFFYWVQARVDEECEGPLAGPDRGHRGSAAKSIESDSVARARVLPGEIYDEITRKAAADSPLHLRITAPSGTITRFWGVVSGDGFESQEVAWVDVPGAESVDGWVVYTPEVPFTPGTIVHMEAGGETSSGAVVGPYGYDFLIVDGSHESERILTAHDVFDTAEGFGPAWSLQPSAAFDAPVKLAVPLPEGLDPALARVYYWHDDGTGGLRFA